MRPFIHINCAMSADGKIAGEDRKQVRISSDEDKSRVKTLRMKYDAILVGVGTILSDNPHLTVKGLSKEENQIRVVIDPMGKTPDDALVLDERAKTIIAISDDCSKTWESVECVKCGSPFSLKKLMNTLYEKGIKSILVEGGGTTISYFFKEGFVDLYSVYVGNFIIGGKNSPTPVDGDGWVCDDGFKMELVNIEQLGDGVLLLYKKS